MAVQGAYLAIIGFIIAIIAIVSYLLKGEFGDKFNLKFPLNAPIIIDRRYSMNSKYNAYVIGKKQKIRMKPHKLRLWVKPIDYEIIQDGKIKKIDKTAKTESLLVINTKDFVHKKESGDGNVPIYEIESEDDTREEINRLRETASIWQNRHNTMEIKYNELLASYGNLEHDIMNIKKVSMLRSATETKSPTVSIETESKSK